MHNDDVYVPPGINMLVDTDATGILKNVVVKGLLIIEPDSDPAHERFFDAHSIHIDGGTM